VTNAQLSEPRSRSHSPSPGTSTEKSATILLVEDDPAQRDALAAALIARDYRVVEAATGAAALQMALAVSPDVVLLDLGLPDVDGIELCRHLRIQLACPVIVVTGDVQEDRMVEALDTGADDYVLKPFSPNELFARIRVALRHRVATAPLVEDQVLQCGDVQVDVAAYQVAIAGELVDLLPRQFDLLVAMIRNEGRVMTYATMARVLWGVNSVSEHQAHSLRTAVSRVRRALGDGPQRPSIVTERHVGYRLVAPDQAGH
jgi:two-component system KDP operon response regulator KdpE